MCLDVRKLWGIDCGPAIETVDIEQDIELLWLLEDLFRLFPAGNQRRTRTQVWSGEDKMVCYLQQEGDGGQLRRVTHEELLVERLATSWKLLQSPYS